MNIIAIKNNKNLNYIVNKYQYYYLRVSLIKKITKYKYVWVYRSLELFNLLEIWRIIIE